MGDLTQKEIMIWEYIKGYMLEYNATPSVKEIAEAAGVTIRTAYAHLYHMEEKGCIKFRGWNNYTVKGMRYVEWNDSEINRQ